MSTPLAAGWHPDPSGHQYRYFDGTAWTRNVADNGVESIDHNVPTEATVPVRPRPPGAPVMPRDPRAEEGPMSYQSGVWVWGIVSAGLLAIGSVGTWATLGPFSVTGTSNGRDGILTLILAGIVALTLLLRRWIWTSLVCGGIALAVTIYDIVDLNSIAQDSIVSPSPGWGILLAAAASASLCAWPFVARNA
jgi:hypothetical protein